MSLRLAIIPCLKISLINGEKYLKSQNLSKHGVENGVPVATFPSRKIFPEPCFPINLRKSGHIW